MNFSVISHFDPNDLDCNVMVSFVCESNVGFSMSEFTNTHMWFFTCKHYSSPEARKWFACLEWLDVDVALGSDLLLDHFNKSRGYLICYVIHMTASLKL